MASQKISLTGELEIPGDKSITHRAIIFSAITEGLSRLSTFNLGRDNFATARIMRQLGVQISGEVSADLQVLAKEEGFSDLGISSDNISRLEIHGRGFSGLKEFQGVLDCGNSGTTARLLCGLLAGCRFSSRLTGDASLVKRPFKRVVEPLSEMGAAFDGTSLPFTVGGGGLRAISYVSPQASAQVKSAIILAGLQAEGETTVTEPRLSRDHTERMLGGMGIKLVSKALSDGAWQVVLPERSKRGKLTASDFVVPGDFSAAAFFLVAASIFPNSKILIRNVGFNRTRIGLYEILMRMGARIEILNERKLLGEEVVDLHVQSAKLHGVDVSPEDVVLAIDEIPILAIAAALSSGKTTIRGAGELRVKESDRLAMTAAILRSFGFVVDEQLEGLTIEGKPELIGGVVTAADNERWLKSGDHRIAMAGSILELLLTGRFRLADQHAVETSFPNFVSCIEKVSGIKLERH